MQKHYNEHNAGKPLVSIVTVVFNGEKYLERTIKSVISQTYPNIEYVVIDGGSKDASPDIIKRHEKHIGYWTSETDKGMYDAINKGLKLAKGSILAYLNSDDLYHQKTVETVVNYFNAHPEVALVYGNCDYINSNGEYLYTYQCPPFNLKHLLAHNWSYISQPTSFWRRNVHEKVGYFDPSLRHVGDFDFFVKVGHHFPIGNIRMTLASFRVHNQSISVLERKVVLEEMNKVRKRYNISNEIWAQCLNLISDCQLKIMNIPLLRQRLFNCIKRYCTKETMH